MFWFKGFIRSEKQGFLNTNQFKLFKLIEFKKFLEKFAAENVLYSVHAFRFYGTKGMKYPVKNIKVYRLDDNQQSLFE